MELNEYQKKAMETCLPTSDNFPYMMLGLVEEVGELAGKVAKSIRKGNSAIGYNYPNQLAVRVGVKQEEEAAIKKEAGDILWMLAGLCHVFEWSLEEVAEMNIEKLAERKKNGTIIGNGDGVTKEERK